MESVPSLARLARDACIKNIKAIVDVGDAPYDLVRPILFKLPTAEQLYEIEQNSPQLLGHTAEVWRAFIKRDVESYSHEEPPEPSNPASWYKVYRKLQRAEQIKIQQEEEDLKRQLQDLEDTAAERTSQIVEARSLPRLHRALGGRVEKRPASTARKTADPSKLRFTGGSRTKLVSGLDVLNKAKREAKELGLFSRQGANGLTRPSHQLQNRNQAPRMAPKSLVDEHQRPSGYKDSEKPAPRILVPRKSSVARASSTAQDNITTPAKTREQVSDSETARKTKPSAPAERSDVSGPTVDDLFGSPEQPRKMARVPRLASALPDKRRRVGDTALAKSPHSTPPPPASRSKPQVGQVDVFMPVKKRRRV